MNMILIKRVVMLVGFLGFLSVTSVHASDVDCSAHPDLSADLVLYNGTVYTSDLALVNVVNSANRSTIAQSIAINSETGCIVYVGDNDGLLDPGSPHVDKNTKYINLKGKLVLPGLVESHAHPIIGADSDVNGFAVNPFSSPDTQLSAIKSFVDSHPELDSYSVDGLGIEIFISTGTSLTREDLDAIVIDKPIRVGYTWGHKVWVNTKTLEDAGISLAPCVDPCVPYQPPGGIIVRDENGVPTGELVEYAQFLVSDQFSVPSVQDIILGLAGEPEGTSPSESVLGQNHISVIESYLSGGFTTVHDMSSVNKATTLAGMQAVNSMATDPLSPLQMRFVMSWYLGPEDIANCVDPLGVTSGTVDCLLDEIIAQNSLLDSTDKFRHNFVKVFMDGTLETFTGSILPKEGNTYVCDNQFSQDLGCVPGGNGFEGWQEFVNADLTQVFKRLNQAGLDINAHAIGDAGVRSAILTLEAVQAELGSSWDQNFRLSIEHLQMVDSSDIARMAANNIIASTSPYWMGVDDFLGLYQLPLLGFDRAYNDEYPLQSFFDAGVLVVGGADGIRLNEGDLAQQVYTGMTRLYSPVLYSAFYCCFASPETGGWQKLFPYYPDLDKTFTASDWNLEANNVFPIGVLPPETERVTNVERMIEMFTINGAKAVKMDDIIGSLEVGKKADVIILNNDILAAGKRFAESQDLADMAPVSSAKVLMTIFNGDVVYVREGKGKIKIHSKPTP